MKRSLIAAVVVTAMFGFGFAQADSDDCGDYGDAPVATTQEGEPGDTAGSATVCIADLGSIKAGGDADAGTGAADVDGDESNSELNACADGFVHAEVGAGGPSVTTSGDGEYDPDATYGDPDPTECLPA